MESILSEWVNLVLRWAHIITGIAWIGSSFLFMWLDSHLEKPDPPRKGVEGELWMTHSGGFYVVEKMDLAPEEVPRTLHWFKWEAAWTWITGFLLLCLMYYYGAEIYLIDRAVADLSKPEAIAIGIALLAASWFVYDALYKSPLRHRGAVVECIGFGLLILVAYGLTHVFSARGAYMHVGAMLGTIMVANVWMIIIPAQQKLVDATKAGTALDARLAFNAKQRSVHNNYMTLPVIFIMISAHYPSTFGHEHAWAVLIVVFIAGALVRHWFNLQQRRPEPSLADSGVGDPHPRGGLRKPSGQHDDRGRRGRRSRHLRRGLRHRRQALRFLPCRETVRRKSRQAAQGRRLRHRRADPRPGAQDPRRRGADQDHAGRQRDRDDRRGAPHPRALDRRGRGD